MQKSNKQTNQKKKLGRETERMKVIRGLPQGVGHGHQHETYTCLVNNVAKREMNKQMPIPNRKKQETN